ncbi:MAG: hypothetical protein ACXV0U_08000 [Kineosporiaceae bacterium]
MTASDHRELVAALLAVTGVADAAVEPDDAGRGPGTLRLQLEPGADEVAVAGAVNRLLRARFGLAVDAHRVRVLEDSTPAPATKPARAEQPPRPEQPPRAGQLPSAAAVNGVPRVQVTRPGRLTIQRVQMLSAGLGVIATVSLGLDGRLYDGEAEGAATTTSVNRCVAVAATRAVEAVVAGRARFEVEHIELTATGRERAVLVVVTMLTGRGSERLSGASVVREDVRQAVIRAVLAAVNRRLEPMLEAS